MSSLIIATNIAGLNTHRSLRVASGQEAKASERLSSGLKINRAADDAAGLAISEKMRNQIKSLNMASKNCSDGISLINTAEGGISEISEMIKRMRELAVQSANDTNNFEDRQKIDAEIRNLRQEINATAAKTQFNTKKLLRGSVLYDSETGEIAKYNYKLNWPGDLYQLQSLTFVVPSNNDLYVGHGESVDGLFVPKVDSNNVIYYEKENRIPDISEWEDLVFENGWAYADPSKANLNPANTPLIGSVYEYFQDADGNILVDANNNAIYNIANQGQTPPPPANNINIDAEVFAIDPLFDVFLQTLTLDGIGNLSQKDADYFSKVVSGAVSNGLKKLGVRSGFEFKLSPDGSITAGFADGYPVDPLNFVASSGASVNPLSNLIGKSISLGKYPDNTTRDLNIFIQSGANAEQNIIYDIDQMDLEAMGLLGVRCNPLEKALEAIERLDNALEYVNSVRTKLGAHTNRTEYTIRNLDVAYENLTVSESRIRDTDMAKEMMSFTKSKIISQAGMSMLAQANQQPNTVLNLMR